MRHFAIQWPIIVFSCGFLPTLASAEPSYWTPTVRYLAVDPSLHEKLDYALIWMECAKPVRKVLELDQSWEKKAGFTNPTRESIMCPGRIEWAWKAKASSLLRCEKTASAPFVPIQKKSVVGSPPKSPYLPMRKMDASTPMPEVLSNSKSATVKTPDPRFFFRTMHSHRRRQYKTPHAVAESIRCSAGRKNRKNDFYS